MNETGYQKLIVVCGPASDIINSQHQQTQVIILADPGVIHGNMKKLIEADSGTIVEAFSNLPGGSDHVTFQHFDGVIILGGGDDTCNLKPNQWIALLADSGRLEFSVEGTLIMEGAVDEIYDGNDIITIAPLYEIGSNDITCSQAPCIPSGTSSLQHAYLQGGWGNDDIAVVGSLLTFISGDSAHWRIQLQFSSQVTSGLVVLEAAAYLQSPFVRANDNIRANPANGGTTFIE